MEDPQNWEIVQGGVKNNIFKLCTVAKFNSMSPEEKAQFMEDEDE